MSVEGLRHALQAMGDCTASELADALGEEVALLAARQGWKAVEQPLARPGIVGQLALPLQDGFAAVATLRWTGPATRVDPDFKIGVSEDAEVWRIEPDAGSLSVTMQGGVCFEPLRRLAEAIDGWRIVDVVSEPIGDPWSADPPRSVTLRSLQEVPSAAERMCKLAAGAAVDFAERHADVDVLLRRLVSENGEQEEHTLRTVALLLTAAGRFEAAGEACGRLQAMSDGDVEEMRRRRRLIRQLGRWIEAEGKLAMPSTPAYWPPSTGPKKLVRVNFWDAFEKARGEGRLRKEALDAVRAVSDGKSAHELRLMLNQEQRRRGLSVEPLQLEWQVREIEAEHEPLGRTRLIFEGLRSLVDLGSGLTKILQQDAAREPERQPDWLWPPPHAAYPVGRGSDPRVAVQLDATARDCIRRAMAQARRMGSSRRVDVWLQSDVAQQGDTADLVAHIGAQRVGVLDAETAIAYRPAMAAAAERDELPWAEGHLTQIPGTDRCLLDIPRPVVDETERADALSRDVST